MGQLAGHYESYFQRANHPARPQGSGSDTQFSARIKGHRMPWMSFGPSFSTAAPAAISSQKQKFPSTSAFSNDRFHVRVGDAELGPGTLSGRAGSTSNNVTWNLAYTGGAAPVFD
jgi:hypothetical protein